MPPQLFLGAGEVKVPVMAASGSGVVPRPGKLAGDYATDLDELTRQGGEQWTGVVKPGAVHHRAWTSLRDPKHCSHGGSSEAP